MDRVEFIKAGLNERQLQAVTTTEGYVRVTAGAGSGKTKTLVNRFAYIVEELGISPSNILCVTFTNKAAQEMRKRVRTLVSSGNVNDFICTYHSFCVKFLREEIFHLFFAKDFLILDDEDHKTILKEVYKELNISIVELPLNAASKNIDAFKRNSNFEYIQHFLPDEKSHVSNSSEAIPPYILLYFKKQLKLSALDFTDLIEFTLYIISTFDDIAKKWQSKFHYILVDETQDNNNSNWAIVNILSERHKNLFIVGDPDQAIYEWRGAQPDFFIQFDKTHSPCTDIIMDENYRSTPNILDVANCVIRNNKNRIEKDLYTRKIVGAMVTHFHAKNEQEEGQWICETIEKLIEEGAKLSDFAVLYRASYLSRFIEQSLIQKGLKYCIFGGIRFFERKEIKDALSYLRLIGQDDDLSFLRIINTPSRKFGEVAKKSLISLSESDGTKLFETLKNHIDEKPFNKEILVNFVNLIENCRKRLDTISISDLLEFVLKVSGLKDLYRLEGDEDRLENLDELMHSIFLYEVSNQEEEVISLTNYLQDIALYTNLDYKEDTEQIKLMTIHQAKGLEFPYVFVAGMTEGIFPSLRTIRERKIKGLEEERRLAYVAMTRAEKALYLTESEGYNFTSRDNKYPSRFILEIKKDFYVIEGILTNTIIGGAQYAIRKIDDEIDGVVVIEKLSKGDFVQHPIFGRGRISSVDEEQSLYEIKFEIMDEEKPISFSYGKLRLLE